MQKPHRDRDAETLIKMETAYRWTYRRRVNLYALYFFFVLRALPLFLTALTFRSLWINDNYARRGGGSPSVMVNGGSSHGTTEPSHGGRTVYNVRYANYSRLNELGWLFPFSNKYVTLRFPKVTNTDTCYYLIARIYAHIITWMRSKWVQTFHLAFY
jgi:hypothetical protein